MGCAADSGKYVLRRAESDTASISAESITKYWYGGLILLAMTATKDMYAEFCRR